MATGIPEGTAKSRVIVNGEMIRGARSRRDCRRARRGRDGLPHGGPPGGPPGGPVL